MKKGFAILLFLIYSLAAFGIVLKEHYCCGKLKSVTIGFVATEKHKCSKDKVTFECCNIVVQNIRVEDERVVAEKVQNPTRAWIEFHNLFSLLKPFHFNSLQVIAAKN